MRHRHRAPLNKEPNVEVSVEVLEKCLDRVALAIDRAGKPGAVYLPIYERIEAELDTLRAKEERMERARHDEVLAWRDGNKPRRPRAAMESEIAVATRYEKGAQDGTPATARTNSGGHNYIDLMGHRFGKLAVYRAPQDAAPCIALPLRLRHRNRGSWQEWRHQIARLLQHRQRAQSRCCCDITLSFWKPRVKQAIRRGIPFEITRQQGWKLYLAQGGRYALTGVEIKFSPNIRDTRGAQTASLDRKDSRFGTPSATSSGYIRKSTS